MNETSTSLTTQEATHLAQLEARVEKGLATFVDVGMALMEIRDSRLYRATHGTFEVYCRERWKMSRSRAHRLIEAADVVHDLLPTGNIPESERVARSLTPLTTEQRVEVWNEAVETAPEGKVTAAHVEQIIHARLPPDDYMTDEQQCDLLIEVSGLLAQVKAIGKYQDPSDPVLTLQHYIDCARICDEMVAALVEINLRAKRRYGQILAETGADLAEMLLADINAKEKELFDIDLRNDDARWKQAGIMVGMIEKGVSEEQIALSWADNGTHHTLEHVQRTAVAYRDFAALSPRPWFYEAYAMVARRVKHRKTECPDGKALISEALFAKLTASSDR